MTSTHRVVHTGECYDFTENRRETDANSAAWKDAKGLLILLGVGVVCLAVWAYGVVQFAEWVRR